MSGYTPTVNAVREAYAGNRYPNVRIVPAYEEFDRMIAEVERAAAARALEEAADDHDQALGGETYGGAYLRARAEAYRREGKE